MLQQTRLECLLYRQAECAGGTQDGSSLCQLWGKRVELESDGSNPKQSKKDIDSLEGVWERFIEAFQGLEKMLCSVKLKKCNQFCLSRKVKRWLPMITSEEVFDHRRLFYLPKNPHNPTTASPPKQRNKQTNIKTPQHKIQQLQI